MSETYDNVLLWAHYADSSKGIALGFEVSEGGKLANPEHCLKVNYLDERPIFNENGFNVTTSIYADSKSIQKISFNDPTFRQAVSTKSTSWSYEKEWRYIEEFSGSYDYPGKLKELIFGLKCSNDSRQRYINLINKNFDYTLDLYEIVILPNSSKLTKIKYENH